MKYYKAYAAKNYNNVSRQQHLDTIESIEHRELLSGNHPSQGYFFDLKNGGASTKREVLETIEVNVPDLFPFSSISDTVNKVSIKNGAKNSDCNSANSVTVANSLEVRVARGTLLPRTIKKGDRFVLLIDDDLDIEDAVLILY
jgi:hypothetical protein